MNLSDDNCKVYSYLVMPRYGINLETLFMKRNEKFTKEQVCSLGIQLLNILQ